MIYLLIVKHVYYKYILEKNRGFAFIEYEDIEDAEAAIDNYDEGELFGKIVKVKPAKPYKPKSFYSKPVWHSEDW